jgi:hypothetical protein
MKKIRIIPGVNLRIPVWIVEEKRGYKWAQVFQDQNIIVAKRMKDHLLKPPLVYTQDDNTPEKPLRTTPSSWLHKPKPKYIKIKRSDLPNGMKNDE